MPIFIGCEKDDAILRHIVAVSEQTFLNLFEVADYQQIVPKKE